jgi:hypothetical protein
VQLQCNPQAWRNALEALNDTRSRLWECCVWQHKDAAAQNAAPKMGILMGKLRLSFGHASVTLRLSRVGKTGLKTGGGCTNAKGVAATVSSSTNNMTNIPATSFEQFVEDYKMFFS